MDVKKDKKVVVLATGGTIAGVARDISKPNNYVSGQIAVTELTQDLDTRGVQLIQEQVCNIDSKDMQFSHWQALLGRCHFWLEQSDVVGVIVTHGTDTLEETAYFLQAVLSPTKPVALTCAMFPANVPESDGPQNLQDALDWVLNSKAAGVHLVCAEEVHFGMGVQKIFSDRSKAFTSRDKLFAKSANTSSVNFHDWLIPSIDQVLALEVKHWPKVDLIFNHSGADGQLVRALLKANALAKTETLASVSAPPLVEGIVVAGTGSGTISRELELALVEAQNAGLWVARTSRCAFGVANPEKHPSIHSLHNLSPVQGRVAMILGLLARRGA